MRPDAPVPGDDYPLTRGRRVVDEFHLDIHPVTVERYEAFLGDGGYEEESWWDPKGWAWRRAAILACMMACILGSSLRASGGSS